MVVALLLLTLFNRSMWEIEKVSAGIWFGRKEFEGIWNGSGDEDDDDDAGAKVLVA